MTKQHKPLLKVTFALFMAAAFALTAVPAHAVAPILFDSVANIAFDEQAGGVHYYDFDLSTEVYGFHEIYLSLDTERVVYSHPGGGIGNDIQFVSAELTSHPTVNLYFSTDRRSVANINNLRLLDANEMDTYDPNLTDPLGNSFALSMRLGFTRALTNNEQYQLGYWAGDLRGMIDPNEQFLESDGQPIPEPGTLILALTGAAGLLGARRRRKRN
ncbi:MAG: PEP-CTERM sorting domain-containing protein [Candidatus Eisenbacteria bacterium]|uniref:PEP-CTERM sorting domain-containing protein n=1 Tax=Eiseniibacteriota bacterium TaxID=2212470 RepID=A0A7Y2H3N3_UNCEI|nr:PEP-CTERM sorting domain-containing protein [Candidatus Eisenbacteria bacterium]